MANFKQFKPTSWSIDNKMSIYVITILITLAGLMTYNSLPKENFPEIVFPKIIVTTVNPGNSPSDIEKNVTKVIEKELESVSGIKKMTSTSRQDFSLIVIDFNPDEDVAQAKQRIKDAVDKAKSKPEFPKDLPSDPNVQDIDISELPIMYVNVAGDYDDDKLKKFAEDLEDRIEKFKEIRRVDLLGGLEREIHIDVDLFKMQSAQITMGDIERAVAYENMTISGGNIDMDGLKRSARVVGEFKDVSEIEDLIIRSTNGSSVYLKNIADVKDTYKEKESYATFEGQKAITLNVVKKGGQNLIEASNKIKALIEDMKKNNFPEQLKVEIVGDQSKQTQSTLNDLINSIIIGFILVVIVLMFFMGTTNAIFVGLSVPLSVFIAFLVMPVIDFNLNMIVLFAFLFALGIIVDDAIVVIENTHRLFENGKISVTEAAKRAAGEVIVPVVAGTITTVCPFIPLAFWNSIIGEFMFFLPITLIVTLTASLLVAFIINPVFAVAFMKPETTAKPKFNRGNLITGIVLGALALLFYAGGGFGVGNFLVFLYFLILLNKFLLYKVIHKFQFDLIPKFKDAYGRLITWILRGQRSLLLLLGMIGLLILTPIILMILPPKFIFFPQGDPNFIYAYVKLPTGTDQVVTDSVTRLVERRVMKAIGDSNKIVDAVITNVGIAAGDPMEDDQGFTPNKGKVTVVFKEVALRNGEESKPYLEKIRKAMAGPGLEGAEITVDQEHGGPPVGKPINIEITGEDVDSLVKVAAAMKAYINDLAVREVDVFKGIEELKTDVDQSNPEIVILFDRERAAREGISTGQVGMEIRTAIFGKEVSRLKQLDDEYKIQLRYKPEQRNDLERVLNLPITYRDMAVGGMVRQIPLRSIVKNIEYKYSTGGIKRKNNKRVITLFSNVLTEYNATEINMKLVEKLKDFKMPEGYSYDMTGEQEEQQETGVFLGGALLTALILIFLVLTLQFNSWVKPFIILSEIVFSLIGVFLGFAFTGMEFSIVMCGIGIVGLAGIVVKNGILIIEFIDTARAQGMKTRQAIVEAGRTRLSPVLLTAASTALGLVPMAIGLNIDFFGLFTKLDPNIYVGGESVVFWGPLSWTIIFGLTFATFLTLVLVPAMYYWLYTVNLRRRRFVRKIMKG